MRQGVAAFRYVMDGRALAEHRRQLDGFDTAETVVRFTAPYPIPPSIVESIVRTRMAEIADTSPR